MKAGSLSPHIDSGISITVAWNLTSYDPDTNTSTIHFLASGQIVKAGGLSADFFNNNGVYRQRINAQVEGAETISFVFRVEQANPSTIIWESREADRTFQHETTGLKTLKMHVLNGGVIAGGSAELTTLDGIGEYELDPINPSGSYQMKGSETTNPAATIGGLKFSWTGTQSEANNRSTINWRLQAADGSTSSYQNAGPVTVTINGSQVLTITSRFKLYGGGAWYKTGTTTINHDSDGNAKMNVAISAAVISTQENTTVNAEFTLDKINRTPGAPTTCTITAGHGNYVGLGDPVTITWSGATGTITGYDVQYRRGNSGWTTLRSISTSAASGSTTDTFSDTDINATGAGKTIQYRVRAKNGSLVSGWRESNSLTMSGAMDINAAGTWKTGTVWINVAGTWKRAKRVWIKDGATWKESR